MTNQERSALVEEIHLERLCASKVGDTKLVTTLTEKLRELVSQDQAHKPHFAPLAA